MRVNEGKRERIERKTRSDKPSCGGEGGANRGSEAVPAHGLRHPPVLVFVSAFSLSCRYSTTACLPVTVTCRLIPVHCAGTPYSVYYVELKRLIRAQIPGAQLAPARVAHGTPSRFGTKIRAPYKCVAPPMNNCLSLGPRSHALGRSVESKTPTSRSDGDCSWQIYRVSVEWPRRPFHQHRLFRGTAIATT
jgi:hypothetical protein